MPHLRVLQPGLSGSGGHYVLGNKDMHGHLIYNNSLVYAERRFEIHLKQPARIRLWIADRLAARGRNPAGGFSFVKFCELY